MKKSNLLPRIGLHSVLILLVVWSVLPFLWTIQTSIKFTRDVAAKIPVLWGYETTGNAYRNFWLDEKKLEDSLWLVLGFIVLIAAIAAFFGLMSRRNADGRPWLLAWMGLVGVHLLVIAENIQFWPTFWYLAVMAVVAYLAYSRDWPAKNWFIGGAVFTLWFGLWRFPRAWATEDTYDFLINSIVVTVLTMLISLSIGLLAGYGLARYSGISGAVILIVALGFRALPRTAFVLPYFFGANRIDAWLRDKGIADWDFPLIDFPFIDELQILDSRVGIVLALVAVNQPFTIWMFRSFFMDVPKELEEAAMMDGATRLEAFRKVIIPVMWPAIIATGLFTLLLAYNEYLFVRVLAPTEWTLPVAIVSLTGGESSRTITEAAAAAVSITLPIVIVIILFQKHLVKGLGAGAVKG
ncbi:carbohydrate ABC transporter permease [Candidatus Poriferisocius sp.]|uniref:carbohydrate ABC transporter permease n=1 Tax=Candidatus Poriferisocius sp. TaxID=3101276 RepID=UPI003B010588